MEYNSHGIKPSSDIIIFETIIYCKFIFTITISLIRLIEIGLDIVLSLSSVQYLPIAS